MTAAARIVRYDVFDIFLLKGDTGRELHLVTLSCRKLPSLSKTAQWWRVEGWGNRSGSPKG
jgi:hypothetical protein